MKYTICIAGCLLVAAFMFTTPLLFDFFPADAVHAADEHGHEDHDGHTRSEETDFHDGHDHGCDHGHDHGHETGHGDTNAICPEHGIPEAEDALCHPDAIHRLLPGEGLGVRLSAPDAGENIGLSISRPVSVSAAEGSAYPGRTDFNRGRFARITPPVEGIIRQMLVRPGQSVEKGEPLAEIASPELSALKASFLAAEARLSQARKAYSREKDLLERGITSRKEYQAAEADFRSAQSAVDQYRGQLGDMGLSPQRVDAFLEAEAGSSVLAVTAPFSGEVSETDAAPGEYVAPGAHLLTIADLDSLWIEISVPEDRMYLAKTGMAVHAEFDGLPGRIFSGRIFQVGAAIDDRSRTLRVLAEVENPDHALKAGMYGRIRLVSEERGASMGVPERAVQKIDGSPYLFIRKSEDLFELRRVHAGKAVNGMVPILNGIDGHEPVVVAQAFALKSEVLKARLGASCADH